MFQNLRNQYRLAAPWLGKGAARTSLVTGEGFLELRRMRNVDITFRLMSLSHPLMPVTVSHVVFKIRGSIRELLCWPPFADGLRGIEVLTELRCGR